MRSTYWLFLISSFFLPLQPISKTGTQPKESPKEIGVETETQACEPFPECEIEWP